MSALSRTLRIIGRQDQALQRRSRDAAAALETSDEIRKAFADFCEAEADVAGPLSRRALNFVTFRAGWMAAKESDAQPVA